MNRTIVMAFAALAFASACDADSLFEDPSFDLWCANKLCAPWEATGKLSRVATWHRSDFGVELGDGSTLSQVSTRPRASCIGLDLIADVSTSAQVSLELDFDDDDSVEFEQLIPESHWAKLSYAIQTPPVYRSLRITLSKAGHGRAVVAQIGAHYGGGCDPASFLPETDRADGVTCQSGAQCASGACGRIFSPYLASTLTVCGACDESHACSDDRRCGTALGEHALYPTCVAPQQELGASCEDDAQCASGHCLDVLAGVRACVQCTANDECDSDEICGPKLEPLGATRACIPPHTIALGARCTADAECETSLCADGTCSQCDDAHPCAETETCTMLTDASGRWLTAKPANVCVRAAAAQESGELCAENEDCASRKCIRPAPICYLCTDSECEIASQTSCVITRQPAGHCR